MTNENYLRPKRSFAVGTGDAGGCNRLGDGALSILPFPMFLFFSLHNQILRTLQGSARWHGRQQTLLRWNQGNAAMLVRFLSPVFLTFLWSSELTLACGQLAKDPTLWESTVSHVADVELIAQQDGTDALHRSTLRHFSVWDCVLPLDTEQCPESSNMKGIELFSMSALDCLPLARIEQGWQDYCSVHFELSVKGSAINAMLKVAPRLNPSVYRRPHWFWRFRRPLIDVDGT